MLWKFESIFGNLGILFFLFVLFGRYITFFLILVQYFTFNFHIIKVHLYVYRCQREGNVNFLMQVRILIKLNW